MDRVDTLTLRALTLDDAAALTELLARNDEYARLVNAYEEVHQ